MLGQHCVPAGHQAPSRNQILSSRLILEGLVVKGNKKSDAKVASTYKIGRKRVCGSHSTLLQFR